MVTQPKWRKYGLMCIGGAALMAWGGVGWQPLRESVLFFFLYWGAFFCLFLAAVYIAILDIRYVRMEYAIAKRELFKDTLGDEKFRQALRQSVAEAEANKKKTDGNGRKRD